MAENSKIEWTDHTFNPWEGCQKVGPGCDHCYAEARNARFSGGQAINWGPGAPRRRTSAANWKKPPRWNAQAEREGRRYRVFCASLADVFDNQVPQLWRTSLFGLIHDTPHLDWLLLTKRIGNAADMLRSDPPEGIDMASLPNLWLGATVVNQEEADRDIPKLLAVPAHVRFLSIEPMLGPITLEGMFANLQRINDGTNALEALDWVIAGGESGPHARPAHPEWFRSLRDQCQAAGVPFLFKQWGEWATDDVDDETVSIRDYAGVLPDGRASLMSQGYEIPFDDGAALAARGNVRLDGRTLMCRIGKRAAGRLLDGVEHNGFPG